jgi:signal transduction histidine kinase
MKYIKPSFLFFYVVALAIMICETGYSQQKKDSSLYYYNKIIKPETSSDLTNAYIFFDSHKKDALVLKDTLTAILDLRYIAEIQNKLGSLYDSEDSAIQAMTYLDNLKGGDTLIEPRFGIYNQLGMIYRQFKDYDKSINYYNKALNIAQDSNHIASIDNNKANVYRDQKKYELAINQFQKVYKFYTEQGNTLKAARALDNLGTVKSEVNTSSALINLEEALKMRIAINHVTGIFTSYLHLAQYYKDRKNYQAAVLYAENALKIANTSQNIKFKENALSMMLDLKQDEHVIEFKALEDSLLLSKQIQENKYAASKYEYDQHLKRALVSELQKEKEKRLKVIYQLIGIFVVLTSIILYFLLKTRYRKDKLQQVYNTETRISKKVHDEVANDVYHVMTKLQGQTNTNEEVLDDLEHIYTRTRDISKESSTIDLNENFEELLNDLLLTYKSHDVSIITKGLNKINWDGLSDLKKTSIYRVLQELMTNMRKHSKASVVALTFQNLSNKIEINYKDNGVGGNLKKNNGLLNTENRIKTLNGTITFESKVNKGFKAKITI